MLTVHCAPAADHRRGQLVDERTESTAEVIESREWDATATTDDIRVTATSAPAPLHLILILVIFSSGGRPRSLFRRQALLPVVIKVRQVCDPFSMLLCTAYELLMRQHKQPMMRRSDNNLCKSISRPVHCTVLSGCRHLDALFSLSLLHHPHCSLLPIVTLRANQEAGSLRLPE